MYVDVTGGYQNSRYAKCSSDDGGRYCSSLFLSNPIKELYGHPITCLTDNSRYSIAYVYSILSLTNVSKRCSSDQNINRLHTREQHMYFGQVAKYFILLFPSYSSLSFAVMPFANLQVLYLDCRG